MGGSRVMPDAGKHPSASDGIHRPSFGFSPPSPQSTAASAMECDCDTPSPHRDAVTCMSANSSMVEVVRTMMKQEDDVYAYERYRPPECQTVGIKEKWRQDICHWTYSVVDHFDLSRETVAISLSLFDRYMATLGNECTGSVALLTSLTTLFVAVKINETKNIQCRTLADLSRQQFTPKDIEKMEIKLLKALSWQVNPPTSVAFVHHLLKFVSNVHPSVRRDLFELSRYLCELSLCDTFFCDRKPSSVAYAAILNVFDFMAKSHITSSRTRKRFVADMESSLHLQQCDPDVIESCSRMREMFASSLELYAQDGSLLSNQNIMDCCASVCSKGSVDSKKVGSSISYTEESPQRVQ